MYFLLSLLYFGNAIATNQLQQKKKNSSYFGNAIATNSFPQVFFSLNFGNDIAKNQLE